MNRARLAVLTVFLALLSVRCADGPLGVQEITQLPRDLTVAEEELIQSDNAFGLKLFREIHAQGAADSNIFISPLSVAMALGMTYNGAAGETQLAMQETLELQGLTIEEVNQAYRSLIDLLRNLDPSVEFLLANSIWYREGFAVEQDFLDVNREYFDAEVTALDFSSPSAAPTINSWVSEKTRGRIEKIVDDPIDWLVVMYLINAIYFKGDWTIQFDPELTADWTFYLADGGQVQAPMMTYGGEVDVRSYADAGVSALDLYYGGKAYSMTILLPPYGGDVGSLIESLDSERWQEIVDGLSTTSSDVVLPKFTLEYELEMKDVLTALGMGIAFGDAADFTKIRASGGLYISKVKHKTFVDVNEEGTEAAAVTAVEIREVSMPPTFVIDRPFIFAIREQFSGTILFMGRIVDPTQSG
ncbi:MAG: serpin family protein [Gemmatimonadota bacterium]|nr:MAG: serpin family protein [Gemmatimonadota bacterium]